MFLGLDIGTTGIKGLVVDDNGKLMKSYNYPLEMQVPKPGWAEQHPDTWYEGVMSILGKCSKEYTIQGIGFSGQMHSLVLLDEKDRVLRDAILWCDQRTTAQCRYATEQLNGEREVIDLISNPILEGFTLGKLLWVRENEPDLYRRIAKIMLPKDYICYKLTGSFGIDFSDASGTAFFDVVSGQWSDPILDRLDINRATLPPVYQSNETRGTLKKEIADKLGWPETAVVSGGADNAVAAYGIGIKDTGDTMVSIGTSGTVFTVTDSQEPDYEGKLHLFRHVTEGRKYYMGVMLSAAHSLNWMMKQLRMENDFSEIENQLKAVSPGAGGLLFLPYLNGERTPHRDPNARGVLFGLSSKTTRAEIIRAVIEGVTFGLRDSFELIREKTGVKAIRVVGGGAKNREWCRILANNFKSSILIPEVDEGGAYGAAMLAAKGTGLKEEALDNWVKIKESIEPDTSQYGIYDSLYNEFQGLYRDLRERFSSVHDLFE